MVSYMYTKTSSRVWIDTPKKDINKLKINRVIEFKYLQSNFFSGKTTLGLESYCNPCLLSTKK